MVSSFNMTGVLIEPEYRSMDQVKPKDLPPDDPKPPVGCSDFDFVGWAKEAADVNMAYFLDGGEVCNFSHPDSEFLLRVT